MSAETLADNGAKSPWAAPGAVEGIPSGGDFRAAGPRGTAVAWSRSAGAPSLDDAIGRPLEASTDPESSGLRGGPAIVRPKA